MKLGMGLPQYGSAMGSVADLRRFVVNIEEMGYDTLWAADRLFTPLKIHSYPPGGDDEVWAAYLETLGAFGDPFPVLAAAAAVTTGIRFNIGTLNAPLHQPIHLARTLTTLDVLCDGRLDVGFGLGWMRDEYDALGLPWSSRGDRLDDMLSFLHTWWTTNPVEYESSFISLPPSRIDLRPIQSGGPPIFLGGSSLAALTRVGRRAEGWIGFDTIPEEEAQSLWSTARRAAEETGRDPDQLKKLVRVNGVPGESVVQLADRLARTAEQGADEAIVDFAFTYPTIDARLDAAGHLMQMAVW
ncbi:TIGR03619 family F420-dependent LLM class oxidoreductase [Mycobacterium sp. NPDC049093]